MEFAIGGVFFQQVIQNFAGFRGEVAEERGLLFLHAVGPLAAGEHGCVEGEMTKQIERVGIRFARLRGNLLEINSALGKLVDDVGALAGVGPSGAQFVRAGTERPHFFAGVIGEFDDPELFAVGIQFVDEFGGDFDPAAIEIIFTAFFRLIVSLL